MTFKIITLGCKVNTYESEMMKEIADLRKKYNLSMKVNKFKEYEEE